MCGLGGNQADLSFARSEVAPHWAAGDRGFAGRRKSRELARVALLAGGGGRRRSSDSNFLAKAEIGRAIGILTDASACRPQETELAALGTFLSTPDSEWGGAGFGCGEVGVISSLSCAEVARARSSAGRGQWRGGRGGWICTNKNRAALPDGEAAGVSAQAVYYSGEVDPPRGPPISPESQRMSCQP